MCDERRESSLPLIPSERPESLEMEESSTESIGRRLAKYSVLIDAFFPIFWSISASTSTFINSLIYYLEIVVYTISINAIPKISMKLLSGHGIILIFSVIYSILYVIMETIVMSYGESTVSQTIPEVGNFFGLFFKNFATGQQITFFSIQIVNIVFGITSLGTRKSISEEWFSRAKAIVLPKTSPIVKFLYFLGFGFFASDCKNSESIYIIGFFGLITALSAALQVSVYSSLCFLCWFVSLIIPITYLIFNEFIFSHKDHYVPEEIYALCCCVMAYSTSVYIGANIKRPNKHVRLIGKIRSTNAISYIAPYILLAFSCYTSIADHTWQSFAALVIELGSVFFGYKFFNTSTRYIYAIHTLLFSIQYCVSIFIQKVTTATELTKLLTFIFLGILAECTSQCKYNESDKEPSNAVKLTVKIVTLICAIVAFLMIAIYESKMPSLSYCIPLLICIGMCAIGRFGNISWAFLMFATFVAICLTLLGSLIESWKVVEWLVPQNGTLVERTYPLMVIFVLSAICRYFFSDPPHLIIVITRDILIFIGIALLLLFSPNSVFTCIYYILLVIWLFIHKSRPKTLISLMVFTALHLVVVSVYKFDNVRNVINSELMRALFGFPLDGSSPDTIALAANLICVLVLCSFTLKFKEENESQIAPWAQAIFNNCKYVISLLSFYLFWASIYASVMISKGQTIVGASICIILGLGKLFGIHGSISSIILFAIYVICILLQTVASTYAKGIFKNVLELMGPTVSTVGQRAINILVIFSMYTCLIPIDPDFVPHNVLNIIRSIFRNVLIVIVQASLVLMGLCLKSITGAIGVIFAGLIMFRPRVGRVASFIFSMLLTLNFADALAFAMINLKISNWWSEFLLLTNVSQLEFGLLFVALFSFQLYRDFGKTEVHFGNTVLTAHGFTIIMSMCAIFSVFQGDFGSFVNALFIFFSIIISGRHRQYFKRGVFFVMLYTYILVVFKALRSLAAVKFDFSTIDICLGLTPKSTPGRLFTYVFEFLLVIMMDSNTYNEIAQREQSRMENRKRRSEIVQKIVDLDDDHTNAFFIRQIENMKTDFETLIKNTNLGRGTLDYVISSPHIGSSKESFNENTESSTSKNNSKDKGEEEERNRDEEEEENKPSYIMIAWGAVLKFFKSLFLFTIDMITIIFIYMTDVNIEQGFDTQKMQKLLSLMEETEEMLRQGETPYFSSEAAAFLKELPMAFFYRFELLRHLGMHHISDENRWELFKRYSKQASRQIMPYLLHILCILYPMIEHNLFAVFMMLVSICSISFNSGSYLVQLCVSCVLLMIRALSALPWIRVGIDYLIGLPSEVSTPLPLTALFGLTNYNIAFEIILFFVAFCAQVYTFYHPNQIRVPTPNLDANSKFSAKFKAKFCMTAASRMNYKSGALFLDLICFLTSLFVYTGWMSSGDLFSMVNGTSTFTVDYVIFLIGLCGFMLVTQLASNTRSPLALFVTSLLYTGFTFGYMLFLVPYMTWNRCFAIGSFKFVLFCRLASQFLIALHLRVGFRHEPPHEVKGNSILIYIMCKAITIIPFVFEFITTIKWVGEETSVSLLQFLTVEELKLWLMAQREARKLWPDEDTKKSPVLGYLILFLLIAVLFVPFILMTRSSQTSLPNPATTVSLKAGVVGLPDFYTGQIAPNSSTISSEYLKQIRAIGDTDLDVYAMMPTATQFLSLPSYAESTWQMSRGAGLHALAAAEENSTDFVPYVTYTMSFGRTTTKNNVESVSMTSYGRPLQDEGLRNLTGAIKAALNQTAPADVEICVDSLLPVFFKVALSTDPLFLSGYRQDVCFTLARADDGALSWEATAMPDQGRFPPFLRDGDVDIVLWSQPSFDEMIGAILGSTGGIIGLYAFIIVTIGQFVRMAVDSLFNTLWIDYMPCPERLLNVLISIEAYRAAGDLRNEFVNTMLLLEACRSKSRLIALTEEEPKEV